MNLPQVVLDVGDCHILCDSYSAFKFIREIVDQGSGLLAILILVV